MPGPGGPTAQSGILFQNRAAALWLGRLLDPRPRPPRETATTVRVEAPEAVDDILVTFADGHREYIQVKESLEPRGDAWEKMWVAFARQRAGAGFGERSLLVLLLGHEPEWARALQELCLRASGLDAEEWEPERLPKALGDVLAALRNALPPGSRDDATVFALLRCTEVRLLDPKRVREDQAPVWMPPANVKPFELFDRLFAKVGGEARYQHAFTAEVLRRELAGEGCRIYEPGEPLRPARKRELAPELVPETVHIPVGPLLMGSDPGPGIPEHETPQHIVTLPAYRIGKYPVTNRQYGEFIRREKAQDVPKDAGWFLREPPAERLDHPVTGVSWFDAVAYCRWLSQQTGRPYRLPSEAEWEKAARGPHPGPSPERGGGSRYPWGDDWDPACTNAASGGTTPATAHPAGASSYGCEDMLGNAQEWTATLWGTQSGQPQQSYRERPDGGPTITDPADLPAQARLVHRGGSYKSQPGELRCSARGSAVPDSKIPWRGFRVAMEV
jgi:formylglycine-generating enzyme required for sulfatase activity